MINSKKFSFLFEVIVASILLSILVLVALQKPVDNGIENDTSLFSQRLFELVSSDNIDYVAINSAINSNYLNNEFKRALSDYSNIADEIDILNQVCEEYDYSVVSINGDNYIYPKYSLKRLIVNGKIKNHYGAIEVVSGYLDYSVLIFDSISATQKAYKMIKDDGYNVVIDQYISTSSYAETEYGYTGYYSWGAKAMDIAGYREYLGTQSNQTKAVVVIDTGINTYHTMFNDRFIYDSNNKIVGKSYIDTTFTSSGYDFEDDNGHGTHVSGIICDLTPSNIKIIPMRALGKDGSGTLSAFLSALQYVNSTYSSIYDIACVNMSLGFPNNENKSIFYPIFNSLLEKNILCCVAGGNEASLADESDPGSCENVLTISSLKKVSNAYEFDYSYSNYGSVIDFSAPGSAIQSAYINSSEGATSKYAILSGTSMACPHASAIVALLTLSHPNYQTSEIVEMMKEYCLDLGESGWDEYYGYGMLNLRYFEVETSQATIDFKINNVSQGYRYYKNFTSTFNMSIECSDDSFLLCVTSNSSIPSINNGALTTNSTVLSISGTKNIYAMGIKVQNDVIIERTQLYNISFFYSGGSVASYLTVNTAGEITSYSGYFENLQMPSTIGGIAVKSIYSPQYRSGSVFRGANMTTLILPESMTSIGKFAFIHCRYLNNIQAPNVTEIKDGAFISCTALTSLHTNSNNASSGGYFPKLINIGSYGFWACTNLIDVSLDKVTASNTYSFALCYNLKNVYLPALNSITDYSFYVTKNLETFYIGEKISDLTLSINAFNSSGVQSFILSPSNNYLYCDGQGVYSSSSLLVGAKRIDTYEICTTATINGMVSNITAISDNAFCGAVANELVIPSNITYIGKYAFRKSNIKNFRCHSSAISSSGYIISSIIYPVFDEAKIQNLVLEQSSISVPQDFAWGAEIKNVIFNSSTVSSISNAFYKAESIDTIILNFDTQLQTTSDFWNKLISSKVLDCGLSTISTKVLQTLPSNLANFGYIGYNSFLGYYEYSTNSFFTITATAGENGSIAPSGATVVNYGESITYTITPNEHYLIDDVQVDNISVGAVGSYTFNGVSQNHSISATFKIETFTITIIQSDNGQISCAQQEFEYGQNATISILANVGYHIEYLIIDGEIYVANQTYTFFGISQNHTFSATFSPNTDTQYFVNHYKESLSQTNIKIGDIYYELFETIILFGTTDTQTTATINDYVGFTSQDFEQTNIDGDGSSKINIYYIRNIFAINIQENEGILQITDINQAKYGQNVAIIASIKEGFNFIKWNLSENIEPEIQGLSISFIMPNAIVDIGFETEKIYFNIQVICGKNGQATHIGDNDIFYGENFVVEFIANTGYHVSLLKVNGQEIEPQNSYAIQNVYSNYVIEISFTINTYSISVVCSANGSSNKTGETVLEYSQSFNASFYASVGHYLAKLEVNNIEIEASTYFEIEFIDKDYLIVAYFDILKFTISVEQTSHGTISPSTSVYNYGSDARFNFMCELGYEIQYILIDDMQFSPSAFYIFRNLSSNHTLKAVFVPSNNTRYLVCHYIESLVPTNIVKDGVFYTLSQMQELFGTTDTQTSATINDYLGFTSQDFEQTNIDGSGNSKVEIYYSRNLYSLSLSGDRGVINVYGANTYKYGQSVSVSADIKQSHNFISWSNSEQFYSSIDTTFAMPAHNIELFGTTQIKTYTINLYSLFKSNIVDFRAYTVEYGEEFICKIDWLDNYGIESIEYGTQSLKNPTMIKISNVTKDYNVNINLSQNLFQRIMASSTAKTAVIGGGGGGIVIIIVILLLISRKRKNKKSSYSVQSHKATSNSIKTQEKKDIPQEKQNSSVQSNATRNISNVPPRSPSSSPPKSTMPKLSQNNKPMPKLPPKK